MGRTKKIDMRAILATAGYAQSAFNREQLHELRIWVDEDVDIGKYASPEYDWLQLWQIRSSIRMGKDVIPYINPTSTIHDIRKVADSLPINPQLIIKSALIGDDTPKNTQSNPEDVWASLRQLQQKLK